MDLRGRRCLLVGGGEIAARKAALLVRAQARLHIVAPELNEALEALVASGQATHRLGSYEAADLPGAMLVIAATDQRAVNAAVSKDAQAQGTPVNVVDDPALCTCIVPAFIDRSPVLIAVSSGGSAPVLARMLRGKLEAAVPARYAELAALCARLRPEVKASLRTLDARRAFWEQALDGSAAELALQGESAAAERQMRRLLAERATGVVSAAGEIYFVGVGPGDPDLLSFRALRLLQRADALFYEPAVPLALVDLCRRDAARNIMAAPLGAATTALLPSLVRLSGDGLRVGVLLLGAGLGGREQAAWAQSLRAAGIAFQTVPGVAAIS